MKLILRQWPDLVKWTITGQCWEETPIFPMLGGNINFSIMIAKGHTSDYHHKVMHILLNNCSRLKYWVLMPWLLFLLLFPFIFKGIQMKGCQAGGRERSTKRQPHTKKATFNTL